MKNVLIMFMLLLIVLPAAAQQGRRINHYLFNGLYINPAYSGYREALNFHSVFNSGGSQTGAPQRMAMAVDGSIFNGNGGLGLLIKHDQAGAQRSSSAYANLAYRLNVGYTGTSRLAIGFGLGVMQGALNVSRSVIDGEQTRIKQSMETTTVPDLRIGAFYSNPVFFAGFSVENMVGPFMRRQRADELVIPLPGVQYFITMGGKIPIIHGFDLKPSVLLEDHLAEPSILHLNALTVIANKVQFGAFYRKAVQFYDKPLLANALENNNSMGFITEWLALDQFRIGYAFDYALATQGNFSRRSHEIVLGVRLGKRKDHYKKGSLSEFSF